MAQIATFPEDEELKSYFDALNQDRKPFAGKMFKDKSKPLRGKRCRLR
ncbi:MAG: hypothetical protein K8F91_05160 [Candidatus Obscuribacterales bacterium]|nr:hypothetical protein [Candidatus Obscuribacterales bacterium]